MQPRTESASALEARLAKTLLADLIDREANDYVSIEIVREPSELAKTSRFRRKPNEHVLTTRFSRAVGLRSAAPEELGTVPYEKQSEPYERVDIQSDESQPEDDSIPFLQIDVWESGELVASSNLVA